MSQPKRDTTKPSPMRLVLVLLLAILTIEFGIMAFLVDHSHAAAAIDSVVLIALLFPILFFVLFRPLTRQVKELEQARKDLERTGEALQHHQGVLEQTVVERTERLSRTTERLSLVLDAIEEGVWDWQVQSGELYNSPGWARMLGYAPEELSGRLEDYTRCLLEEERAAIFAALDAHMAGQTPGFYSEHRMRRKDGQVIWVADRGRTVAWDEQGQPSRVVGAISDITARKQTELQLRNSERRYRQIIQTSMDGFWIADTEGRILDVNDAYCQLTGYNRDELLHMRIPDVEAQETPEETARHIQEIRKQGHTRFETRHRRKDGQLLDMEVSVEYRPDEESGPVFLRDITERKRAQLELVALNAGLEAKVAARTEELAMALEAATVADRMKSEFMANVTHELRTPLNSVIGFAELLKDEVPGPLNAKQVQFAADILASGQRLLKLVEGILDMSRLDMAGAALEREPVDIGPVLEERVAAHRKAAETGRISIALEVAADAGCAELDPKALRRMFDALLDNAIKFNREGGAVAVSARRDDGWLKIAVADTGIGIAQEDLPKLFRPLVQLDAGLARRHGGVGLGLALARQLAELHGGTIEVESEPGKGSTFTLRLRIQEKS